jgi:hypothetical protein
MFCGNSPASQGARRETSARTRTQIILRGQRHDRFRPKETQEGDLICQFKNSDVIAIVRAENFRYRIIGRCVEFLAGDARSHSDGEQKIRTTVALVSQHILLIFGWIYRLYSSLRKSKLVENLSRNHWRLRQLIKQRVGNAAIFKIDITIAPEHGSLTDMD